MRIQNISHLRRTAELRDSVAQTKLHPEDLIMPYFVRGGTGIKEAQFSMPGQYVFSADLLLEEIGSLKGVKSILLFGIADNKNSSASSAYDDKGIIQEAIRKIKKEYPGLTVYADVCLCAYTDHGHCGILKNGEIDSELTLETLAVTALSYAKAGADYVAPSAMADFQVEAIRRKLDKYGYKKTKIMSYSAKYSSNFYWPFRDVMSSSPVEGDRSSYQMDYRNSSEAIIEAEQDIAEGSDIVMVKPALSYLDVIKLVSEKVEVPLAAYSVSGEYVMIKNAANGDPATERKLALEVLYSIKRAGADIIISYWSALVVKWLNNGDINNE